MGLHKARHYRMHTPTFLASKPALGLLPPIIIVLVGSTLSTTADPCNARGALQHEYINEAATRDSHRPGGSSHFSVSLVTAS